MPPRRDLAVLRAALLAGVNAVFDALEASAAPARTVARPAARPEGEYNEVDAARADAILRRYGVK